MEEMLFFCIKIKQEPRFKIRKILKNKLSPKKLLKMIGITRQNIICYADGKQIPTLDIK